MKELRTAIEINASADTVWAILTDLGQFAAWNPFMPEAEGEIREGARLKVRIAPPGSKAMTFMPTVTRVEPGREFRWLGRLLFPGLFDGHAREVLQVTRFFREPCFFVKIFVKCKRPSSAGQPRSSPDCFSFALFGVWYPTFPSSSSGKRP